MDIGTILIWSILLFFIIYISVRLAINPLLRQKDEIITEGKDLGLVKLRDIEVLSNAELEEVIEIYQHEGVRENDHEQYQKYAKVLNELKEMGYFSEEQYLIKVSKLKMYYKISSV